MSLPCSEVSRNLCRYFCMFCRVKSISAFAIGVFAATPAFAQIVVNEIHFSPDVKTEAVEFIELCNTSANVVNLSGWQLTDAVNFTFPNGTSISPNGFVVIAQNPAALQTKFGTSAFGPWTGKLSNGGDKIVLKNAAGGAEDEVEYQLGFPWPTVGDAPGYSIELINPGLDNNLGGNWRASVVGNPTQESQTLFPDHSAWKYFKGTSEASSPTTLWRTPGFNDASWLSGAGTFGYGENFITTLFNDMQGNYSTVFFRKTFVVDDPSVIQELDLEVRYDDGFKVWINGTNVANANISTGEVPYNGTASSSSRESSAYDLFILGTPRNYLVPGTNVISVLVANASRGNSSDFFFDARLRAEIGPIQHGPTPGATNSVFTTNAPPQIRQVDHSPNQPLGGSPVTVTAKITDPEGVSAVTLKYQIVIPGNYIELTDAAYTNNWTSLTMNDNGTNGDALAGDSIYTAIIPASVQQHRRLIRYRISATDGVGDTITAPYADDPQPNFAYFCYNGVPAWQGAVQPGTTATLNFTTNVMGRLPVVHLIAKNAAVNNATWFSRYAGDLYQWAGTLVYDGKVYDHIHYRARGGVWRYAMVKNMWKFDFNRGHDLEMRDDWGRKYDVPWTKLNLGACIQQGSSGHRGEQGMFESVGSRLFNHAGVPAFNTSFIQFRVIDAAAESTPGNQYEGDFWGLYLGVEQEDGRFLEQHDLPDGNFYKMENGTGELNNLDPLGPTDKSDLNYLLNNYTGASDAWWRTNWLLTNYYSYQTIVQAIHHYDINAGKNYFYLRRPGTNLWQIVPWDLDLTWAHNMFNPPWGGLNPLASRILQATNEPGTGLQSGTYNLALTGTRPAFELEFRNRVREIRDLLFNTNQTWQLIDECASLVLGPTNFPTFLDADRCLWDFNPKMTNSTYSSAVSQAGQGLFYQWPNEPSVSRDFNGCIRLMKNYVVVRSEHLDALAADAAIPSPPTISYIGGNDFPLNHLIFRSSNYSGSAGFAAMQWRIGEVLNTNAPAYDATEPQPYEISAKWESAELTNFNSDIQIPADALKTGHAYRARVRVKDVTGRWSHWSEPIEFITTEPESAAALVSYLRVSEVMYDPPAGSDYEFIELHNSSPSFTLDLSGAAFTAGVNFTFPNGASLPPNAHLLVIRNPSATAFRSYYALSTNVLIAGPYSGSLANDGEQLTLKTAAGGTEISAFEFGEGRGWPVAAAGAGHSLVPLNPDANGQATGALDYPGNWRASTFMNGSPGYADPAPPAPTIVLNEIVAHTDYTNAAKPEYDSDDWIELYNTTGTNILLSSWYLSDDPNQPAKWMIPAMTVPARGWLSFDEVNDFHNPITSGFGLDKAGEQVLLSYLPGGASNRVVDAVAFKGQENETALSRFTDGAPFWQTAARTRDAANSAPQSGPRFSEIVYHPTDLGTNDNTRDEFIELTNPTLAPIELQNELGSWRLDGGVHFTFPTNTVLPVGGSLLVVSFNPADTATSNAFRAVYGITNMTFALFGPYSGKLGNRSDRVALERPQYPDLPGDDYSWVIVDEIIYGNQSPWPVSANGGGASLQRRAMNESGNDPANWFATVPTPASASLDRDGDGLPDDWESEHGLNPDNPGDASLDSDHDGVTNLQEFFAGTDPQSAASVLGFSSIACSNNSVTLRFTAVADRAYEVERRDSLNTGSWQNLTNIAATETTRTITISDPLATGVSNRFYRLVIP